MTQQIRLGFDKAISHSRAFFNNRSIAYCATDESHKIKPGAKQKVRRQQEQTKKVTESVRF